MNEERKTIGRPWVKGRSGNPGGRTKNARVTAYAGLVQMADMIAADTEMPDAEKVVALLGLLRGGLGLLKRYARSTARKRATDPAPLGQLNNEPAADLDAAAGVVTEAETP